jgi:ribosomal protein S13
MISHSKILRTIKSFLVEVVGIGGTTQERLISPKGLYSKPVDEKAIVINLSNGNNQNVVLAIQKDVNLQDNDVYLTDDKSFIHFHFKDGTMTVKSKKIDFNADEINFNTSVINYTGVMLNDGVPVDGTHTHLQNDGNDAGGGVNTEPPTGV